MHFLTASVGGGVELSKQGRGVAMPGQRKINFSGITADPVGEIPTLSAFAAGWIERRKKTRRSWDTDASRLGSYLAPSPLWALKVDKITPAMIAGLLEALTASGLSASTVKRTYSLISTILKDAAVRGFIKQTPCILGAEHLPRPDRMQIRNKVITAEDMRTLIEGVPIARGALYLAAYLTGARVGEIAGLRWLDYEHDHQPLRRLHVQQQFHTGHGRIEAVTKTGVPKLLPVHSLLKRALAVWRLQWPVVAGFQPFENSPIFITQIKRQHWRKDSLRNVFKRDLERLGLDASHTPHDFRHSFITAAQAAGASADMVRKITHPTPRTIMDVYTHHEWARLCAVVSAIKLPAIRLAV